MFSATFILSTGRCGTQWLAENLATHYGDRLCVEHEPLHDAYRPRLMLGAGRPENLEADAAAPILAHMDFIESQLQQRDYLECGHPCWSTIPYLIERFRGRVRIVHLFRDPVPTSLSWLTHGAYQQPLLPHMREKILLSPFDAGVSMPEYAAQWPVLSAYEKCLYYWGEVNQFGLSLQKDQIAPWLQLAFERLTSGIDLEKLIHFMGLPTRERILQSHEVPTDRFRYLASQASLPADTGMPPRIAEISRALGYAVETPFGPAMKARYFGLAG